MGLTWAELQNIRAQGLRPAMPIVLTRSRLGRAMWETLPIITLDDRPALELLSGLRVWLFTGCVGAAELIHEMRERDVWCAELLSWCYRDKLLAKYYGTCTCRI